MQKKNSSVEKCYWKKLEKILELKKTLVSKNAKKGNLGQKYLCKKKKLNFCK